MKKFCAFILIFSLGAFLYAQSSGSRISSTRVFVNPTTGGTPAEREYFDYNLLEEVKGGGYELVNDQYSDPEEAQRNSDFYITVAVAYDAQYRENIVTLELYNTRSGALLITSGMSYQTLDEMNDWNLTMIYRLKGASVFHRQERQGFPVDGHLRLGKTRHEPGIADTLGPAGGVDPDDPDPAEVRFPVPAIPVRVKQPLGNRVFSGFVVRVAAAPIALRLF
ncbi:hypothetical protein FACS189493_6390 [Spirochaetia bacterium]|nr:hypothetical protein FACS189493_6390 [Spirochaetia bacterium]